MGLIFYLKGILMALYIKFDKLEGDVTDKTYKQYSLLNSMHFPAVHNGAQNKTGSAEFHCGGVPQFSPIQVVKPIDSTSPLLFTAACEGKIFKEVTIVDTRSSDSAAAPFSVTTLQNVRISTYSKSHHESGVHPREFMCLTYSSISERLNGKLTNGTPKAPITSGYDLEKIRTL